ncbi:MAG: hypothetical protein HFF42_01975 [Lawsonibacter sp.]|nr:hypothetical protein [Lawsonibacter sp.]
MDTPGIITYDTRHLKTEQILLQLADRYDIRVYALSYVQRPARNVLFQHRPDQSVAVHPRDICAHYGLPYVPVENDAQIDSCCDLYLITGAGILSTECLRGKRILNGHPGVIPAARGLDAFKWSIYHMLPLGVTLHYIDEQVDVGEVVSIVPTPVFPSDTLETLARRHYENEIQTLVHFEEYLQHPQNPFTGIAEGESTRRMRAEQEQELPLRFGRYKQQAVSLMEGTICGQVPPPRTVRKFLTWTPTPHDLRKEAA